MWELLSRSILTAFRFWLDFWKLFSYFFRVFSHLFPPFLKNISNRVSRLFILHNLVWERPSRSIRSAFQFRLEFRKIIFSTFFRIFEVCFILKLVWNFYLRFSVELLIYYCLDMHVCGDFILDLVWERLSQFWLLFDSHSSVSKSNFSQNIFRLQFVLYWN